MKKTVLFIACLFAVSLLAGCGNNVPKDEKAPIYTGMEIVSTIPDTRTKNDHPYILHKNEEFVFEIHFDNPYEFEIQSFTINDKKYVSYMFEYGSTIDLLYIKSVAPDEYGQFSYTIDSIKYIENESIKNVKMQGNQTVSVEVVAYTITLDPNGGEVDEPIIEVDYGDSYVLPTPTKRGYEFLGWFDSEGNQVSNGYFYFNRNIEVYASWEIINYNITYNLNFGINDEQNPSYYNVLDSELTLFDPSRYGYSFLGWYDEEDNKIESINPESCLRDITLSAKWSADLFHLEVLSSDLSKGTVEIISGSGYTDETIKVRAVPNDNCYFKGWFNGNKKVSFDSTYTFEMPPKEYALTALFYNEEEQKNEEKNIKKGIIPAVNKEDMTVTYGLYPQSRVTDQNLISEIGSAPIDDVTGWYYLNEKYYQYSHGQYYECSLIRWNILFTNDNDYLLISTNLLDAIRYYNSLDERTIDGKTVYASNYKYSDLRHWLNNDFYNSAFKLGNDYITTTTIDNSASTTCNSNNPYICEDTYDNVFALSYSEFLKTEYGFNAPESRISRLTDFAQATGVFNDHMYSLYWTRSPDNVYETVPWAVQQTGNLYKNYGGDATMLVSVRPSINVIIPDLYIFNF